MNTQGFKIDLVQQSNYKNSTKPEQLISNQKPQFNSQRKNQMLIDQENELMQMQLEEAKTREENIKQMNANIMLALNNMEIESSANSYKNVKELQQKLEQHIQEIVGLKKKQEQRMQSLEQEKSLLQNQLLEEKEKSHEYQLQAEQFSIILKAKNESFEQELSNSKQEITSLKHQIEELNDIIKEKQQMLEVVGKESTEWGKKISMQYQFEKSNQKQQSKQRLDEIQMVYENKIEELNEQTENLSAINESLAFQLNEKNNDFQKLLKEFNNKCQVGDSELKSKDFQIQELNQLLIQTKQQLLDTEEQNANYIQQYKDLDNEHTKLQDKFEQYQNLIIKMQSKKSFPKKYANEKNCFLSQDLSQMFTQKCHEDLKKTGEEKAKLEEIIEQYQEENNRFQETIETLEQKLSQYQDPIVMNYENLKEENLQQQGKIMLFTQEIKRLQKREEELLLKINQIYQINQNASDTSQTNLMLSDLTRNSIQSAANLAIIDKNFRKEKNAFEQFMLSQQKTEEASQLISGVKSPNNSNFRESQLATTRKFLNQTRQNVQLLSMHKDTEVTETSLQPKPVYHKCQSVANTAKYLNKEHNHKYTFIEQSESVQQQDKKSFRCEICKTCFSPQQLLKSLEKNYKGENKQNEIQIVTSPNCKSLNKQNSIRTTSTIEIEQQLKQATTTRSNQLPNQFQSQELQKHFSVLNSPEMKLQINKLLKLKSINNNSSQLFITNKKLNELSNYSNLESPFPSTSTNNLKEVNLNIKQQNTQFGKKLSFKECSNKQSKENIEQKPKVKHHFNIKQFAKKIEFAPGSPSFEQLNTSKKYAICSKL